MKTTKTAQKQTVQTQEVAKANKDLLVSEYTEEVLNKCEQNDKISETIANNLMLTKLINENFADFKESKFIDIVAYAIKETFKISNLKSEMLSRNYNLRHNIVLRMNKSEVAKTDKSVVIEHEQEFIKAVQKALNENKKESDIKTSLQKTYFLSDDAIKQIFAQTTQHKKKVEIVL